MIETIDVPFWKLEVGLNYFDPFTRIMNARHDGRDRDGKGYVKDLADGHLQMTETHHYPIKGGVVIVGRRTESEEGSWVRFVVVPRRQGRTRREYQRLAAEYGINLHDGSYSHPGGPYSHRGHMRVGRTRVLFTQRGGYDI